MMKLRPGISLERIPWAIGGLGVVLAAGYFLEIAVFAGFPPDPALVGDLLVGFVWTALFAGGLAYGGYWLGRSDVDVGRYRRVAAWCVGGAVLFVLLNVALIVTSDVNSLWGTIAWLRGSTATGGAFGLLIGIAEARAIEGALAAERSRLRAEHVESRRTLLDYLNGLLRHEVLNNAQVIDGYASILEEQHDLDDEALDRIGTIRRQTADMQTTIEDVAVLMETTRGEDRLRSVDVADVLREEVADLRAAHARVEVGTDLPESADVHADELVRRVFSNLLSNAVEHDDSGTTRIEVAAERRRDAVRVTVADNGPGIPAAIEESLFERSKRPADTGFGLHLVSRLVERYGGDVELVETGPQGTVFAVELPRLEDGTGGGPVEATADESSGFPWPSVGDVGPEDVRPRRDI